MRVLMPEQCYLHTFTRIEQLLLYPFFARPVPFLVRLAKLLFLKLLYHTHVPAWLEANVAGTSMTARTRRSGVAEWRSGRGRFPLFLPSAFPFLIHSHLSSELPPVPRLHSDHLFVFLFQLYWVRYPVIYETFNATSFAQELSPVPGHLRDIWCLVVCAMDTSLRSRLCLTGFLGTVYNHSRNVFPTQYSLQISKGCISLALVPAPTSQIRLSPLRLPMQLLWNTSNYP